MSELDSKQAVQLVRGGGLRMGEENIIIVALLVVFELRLAAEEGGTGAALCGVGMADRRVLSRATVSYGLYFLSPQTSSTELYD